jgi:hypothetical protein
LPNAGPTAARLFRLAGLAPERTAFGILRLRLFRRTLS